LFNRPDVYANFRWLLLIALLVVAYFGAGIGIDRAGLRSEWLPIAFVALPVPVLWDTRMSLFLVLVSAAITRALPLVADYGTVLALVAGAPGAALRVRAARRSSEAWLSIARIAGLAGLVPSGYTLASAGDLADTA